MKIIIDIPEHVKTDFDNANIADVDCYVCDYDLLIGKAIKNGIPILDNATNGDVIKAIFPNVKVDFHDEYGCMYWSEEVSSPIYLGWWNAPYNEVK